MPDNHEVVIETAQQLGRRALGIPYEESAIFSVVFVKKNGDVRKMVCRRGVRSRLRGGELGYDAKSKGLLPVFDMNKPTEDGQGAYRMINCETLQELRFKGVIYRTQQYHEQVA